MNSEIPLRHAVIGVGAGVFNMHRPALQLETVEMVAASDVDEERGQPRAEELGCPFYIDHRTMLAETKPDIAVIMTPHPYHAGIAIDCLQSGCHVLVEKPMAVQVQEADAMIEAASRANRLLAVNFQLRSLPTVRAARELIEQGQLGVIQHVSFVQTWTRTAAYYKLGSWRGTWIGEGGGLLMNQAPHNLDLICHLMGMPRRVIAWTRTHLHNIETEDTAQAMLEWPSGAMGTIHVSTAEAGQPQRLEIMGTQGYLRIQREQVTFYQFDEDLREFIPRSHEPYMPPASHPVTIVLKPGGGDHVSIYRNLHEAILKGKSLIADGVNGRMSLELANAMTYSSHTRREVELPLDRHTYASMLKDLKSRARAHKIKR